MKPPSIAPGWIASNMGSDHELLDPTIGAWGAHLNASLFPDQVHPNDAGAAKLAANVYSVLTAQV